MSTIPEQYRKQAEMLESIDLDVLQANVARAIFDAGVALRAAASDIEARDEGMEGLAEARDRLRGLIENAPHEPLCRWDRTDALGYRGQVANCTCWKSEALSQPTPTAEPTCTCGHPMDEHDLSETGECQVAIPWCPCTNATGAEPPRIECPRCKGYGVDPSVQRAGDKVIDCTRCGGDGEVGVPPRIEDLAPGTTFWAGFGDDEPRMWFVRTELGDLASADGTFAHIIGIDPSTIRDVQPPASGPTS